MSFIRLLSRGPAHAEKGAAFAIPEAEGEDRQRLELLDSYEASGQGWFWATDAENKLSYLSDTVYRRYGWSKEDLLGQPLSGLFTTETGEREDRLQRPMAFLLGARNTISALPVHISHGGETLLWEIAGKALFDTAGEFQGYRGSARDITESRDRERNTERLAQHDDLTGLANRRRMDMSLSNILASYRNLKRSCAYVMLDLDRFKQVNDTYGHPVGDELLKQVAARIKKIVGNRGEVGRPGGDEFNIILPDADDRGLLGELSQRLIQMISQPYPINGSRLVIGVSIGIAIAPYDGIDREGLVKAADLALYAAKGGGRGQYRFYSSEMKEGAKRRRQIEEDLRGVLDTAQLAMHYQPIVSADTRQVECFEALMRWNHPERGWISPAEFIPVAEDIDMIKPLGEWALLQVCRDACAWPEDVGVAVNISALQFECDDFPSKVEEVLIETGLEPSRLELEITESVFLGGSERTQRKFEDIKKLGVRLALDDFGTGYSSLSYLRTAPFDKIKIDQSFVRGCTEPGNNNPAIMSAIVNLAQALEMQTVAEGVESKDELELVIARGASHIQGYIFSAPLSQKDMLERSANGPLTFEARGPARYRADRRSVFRRIGVVHEDCRYHAVMRNLSKTGALIEGLAEVPLGTKFVLDLGGGQLVIATVQRSVGTAQGVEFEIPLISDGADGLCTRHRVSPFDVETNQARALPNDLHQLLDEQSGARSAQRQFAEVRVRTPHELSGT
ncbi:putative bifunctional diguanylate cyclase/phosphodiesterase [Qipengyuania spongiae]|uniref:EAL domain-containing protein n=1 Tax=Qipengyuania spongiae TaxID=2909673 RepID=A0ABY5T047_9SPHN|nr:GGDEF and EAL domain-containing protein [Qipengyuania spongiae]UVI38701.1 EAL domain-containing protein [Qipengyuania spongiae]